MITLTREEAQQVLDALDHQAKIFPVRKAIETLRARLALHDMNKAAEQNGEEL